MFPLLERERDNPAELFQIWLNLPRDAKLAEPHFAMLWHDAIPRRTVTDGAGRTSELVLVAGDPASPPPPPSSWAARAPGNVSIWTIAMTPGAELTLPAGAVGANRTLYFFAGAGARIDGVEVPVGRALGFDGAPAVTIVNGAAAAELLMLEGRPIGEPVVQHGPFVMNTVGEIRQAFADYQRTQFGGWPWPRPDPVHARDAGRFARRPDGSVERRGG
jgi:redox-sensitive bicupin YhaK (pirin superfamily)